MASNTRTRGGDPRDKAQAYLEWLAARVQEDGHPRPNYKDLFRILYETDFVWTVPNDMNRIADGLDLRIEYFYESGVEMSGLCCLLEVIVALSRRLAWIAEGSPEGWAWQLLCNLELHKFRDPISSRRRKQVEDILYALIWRTYEPNGIGGFFPLTRPKMDQTKIEIWYQMHAYAMEIHPEY